MAMEDGGEREELSNVQLYLEGKGLPFTELALEEERRRRDGGELEGEKLDELLEHLQLCLQGKGLPFTELALQEERSRRGRAGRGLEGEEADKFMDGLHFYLRNKDFKLAYLALQDERSRRAGRSMEEGEAEKLLAQVHLYLQRKGFRFAELALHEEVSRRATTNSIGVSLSSSSSSPDEYTRELRHGYEMLRAWANNSLDEYKHEFASVLYPLFVQCCRHLVARGFRRDARAFFSSFAEDHEQAHSNELDKMKPVLLATHLKEMALPKHRRTTLRISEHSYELILQYLHRRNAILVFGLINESIKFEVYYGPPSVFPLGKDTMTEMISAVSASALVAISALNLIAYKAENFERSYYTLSGAFLSTLPYSYLPLGLVSVVLSVAAVKNQRLVDHAAGCLFFQFIYLIWVAGVIALACHNADVLRVVTFKLAHALALSIVWSHFFAHPKWLRSLGEDTYGCCFKWIGSVCVRAYRHCTRPRATRAVQTAGNRERDLEAHTGLPSTRLKEQ